VRSSEINFATDEKPEFSIKDLSGVFAAWQKNIDYLQGGSKGEHKFPMPIGYQFLLHYNFLVKIYSQRSSSHVRVKSSNSSDGALFFWLFFFFTL